MLQSGLDYRHALVSSAALSLARPALVRLESAELTASPPSCRSSSFPSPTTAIRTPPASTWASSATSPPTTSRPSPPRRRPLSRSRPTSLSSLLRHRSSSSHRPSTRSLIRPARTPTRIGPPHRPTPRSTSRAATACASSGSRRASSSPCTTPSGARGLSASRRRARSTPSRTSSSSRATRVRPLPLAPSACARSCNDELTPPRTSSSSVRVRAGRTSRPFAPSRQPPPRLPVVPRLAPRLGRRPLAQRLRQGHAPVPLGPADPPPSLLRQLQPGRQGAHHRPAERRGQGRLLRSDLGASSRPPRPPRRALSAVLDLTLSCLDAVVARRHPVAGAQGAGRLAGQAARVPVVHVVRLRGQPCAPPRLQHSLGARRPRVGADRQRRHQPGQRGSRPCAPLLSPALVSSAHRC